MWKQNHRSESMADEWANKDAKVISNLWFGSQHITETTAHHYIAVFIVGYVNIQLKPQRTIILRHLSWAMSIRRRFSGVISIPKVETSTSLSAASSQHPLSGRAKESARYIISDTVLAEISLRSPRKLFIFIVKKIIYRIKVSRK